MLWVGPAAAPAPLQVAGMRALSVTIIDTRSLEMACEKRLAGADGPWAGPQHREGLARTGAGLGRAGGSRGSRPARSKMPLSTGQVSRSALGSRQQDRAGRAPSLPGPVERSDC